MVAQLDPVYRRAGLGPTAVRLVSWALFEGRPLTTRGRWINPLVLAALRLHCRLPRLAPVEAPIFIAGMGRSGTTVLGKILSLHPAVGFLNEPKALWHVAVGAEDVVGSYDRGPARYRLGSADAGARERRRLTRLFAAYLRWTRRTRVLDKSPEVIYRSGFVRRLFPDCRIVVPIRNGWAVARSVAGWCERNARRRGGVAEDWWGADGRKWRLLVEQVAAAEPDLGPDSIPALLTIADPRQRAALEWTLACRHAERCLERADDTLVVHYEDLTAQPTSALLEILGFCDLPSHDRPLRYGREVLRRGSEPLPFELAPALARPFRSAMARWGYEA